MKTEFAPLAEDDLELVMLARKMQATAF